MPLPSLLRAPISARLRDAILSLQPTTLHVLDSLGSVRDLCSGDWTATYTGSPTLAQARAPINTGVTFSGTGQYATTSGSVPTPTASMSALCVFSLTDATAANRTLYGRGASSQFSWCLRAEATHVVAFRLFQADASAHGGTSTTGAVNDGAPHLVLGTYDGTTLRTYRDAQAPNTATPASGTWHKASTAGVQVASLNSAALFPGTVHLAAYWADRVITDAERLWLYSIMAGG